jgi:hypothetical protein
MCARVSSTRSSVLVVLLGNAQQYYLFGWGEVIIHLKLEKVAPSTFFFFSIWRVDLPPAAYSDEGESDAARPLSHPTSPKVSGRLDARSQISTFSHHLFPGVMRAAILFVSLSYLLCVCVDIKSSAWQTQAQDGRRDSVVPNFSQTRPMRLTPSVTECFLRPTWTEIKRNK